ncbi:MAG: sensor histidine kinase [Flavobacteriaceae bacterium]|nr:sensor histidine kinase [Flavobacteriaceae bacterium]
MKNKDSILVENNHNPILFNVVLWVITFIVLLLNFSENKIPKTIDYIYTSSFIITIIVPVVLNLYIFIPFLLKKEKYYLFLIIFTLNIVVFTQLNIWFFNYFIDYLFPDYYFISYHSNTKLITFFTIFLVVTTLIKLAEDWFYFNKKEKQELKIKNQQIQAQLSSLRSQINPHFLFNSLNVIYALAIEKKEETKDAIVKLSDVLRYVIYDASTPQVTLKDEIKLLNNYIEFQKFRHRESEKIKFSYNVINDDYTIYPMLLLPLLENSFKYGIKGNIVDIFININLTQKDDEITFYIENNYVEELLNKDNDYSGVGIVNIKRNLEIVYPNKHEFTISKSKNTFVVVLKLFNNEN